MPLKCGWLCVCGVNAALQNFPADDRGCPEAVLREQFNEAGADCFKRDASAVKSLCQSVQSRDFKPCQLADLLTQGHPGADVKVESARILLKLKKKGRRLRVFCGEQMDAASADTCKESFHTAAISIPRQITKGFTDKFKLLRGQVMQIFPHPLGRYCFFRKKIHAITMTTRPITQPGIP